MKTRIKLESDALLHHRTRKGLSLKVAAECLRKNSKQDPRSLLNMYHRIERTGITSPATAAKIAAMLKVDVAQLSGDVGQDDYLWWMVGPGFEDHGRLVKGFLPVWQRVRSMIEPWEMLEDPQHIDYTQGRGLRHFTVGRKRALYDLVHLPSR